MIASFFRSLDDEGVAYLLISGQATVLYGAATFSEDIDLWIKPTSENCDRFIAALRRCKARYYKLTPALTVEHMARGHGFHFIFDDEGTEVFLDIMGRPPRVESFTNSYEKMRLMESEWGQLPTIGLKDLVELKKTQRLEDYPIISNLVLTWFDLPERSRSAADFEWGVDNIFTTSALRLLFSEHPAAIEAAKSRSDAVQVFARTLNARTEVPQNVEEELAAALQEKVLLLQRADRAYWRAVIDDLRQLRTAGVLVQEGTLV